MFCAKAENHEIVRIVFLSSKDIFVTRYKWELFIILFLDKEKYGNIETRHSSIITPPKLHKRQKQRKK